MNDRKLCHLCGCQIGASSYILAGSLLVYCPDCWFRRVSHAPPPDGDISPALLVGRRLSFEQTDDLRVRLATITAAALAVVQHWETPLWKDAEPTAAVIARLRWAIGP